jgi:hypothetical protein
MIDKNDQMTCHRGEQFAQDLLESEMRNLYLDVEILVDTDAGSLLEQCLINLGIDLELRSYRYGPEIQHQAARAVGVLVPRVERIDQVIEKY